MEPVDGGFGLGEDLPSVGGHVVGAVGELEQEDDDAAFEVVKDHPPGDAAAEDGGLGGVNNKVEDGAGGVDAVVGESAVRLLGAAGLADDVVVNATEAGAVDDGAGAVEEDAEGDAARGAFSIGGGCGGVEGLGEVVPPVEETLVEGFDDILDGLPFLAADTGGI